MKSLTALDLNSNRINNLLDPSVAQDAATKNYVDTRPALPAGSSTQLQYNNGGTALGGISQATYDGNNVMFLAATGLTPRFILADSTTNTKRVNFDLSSITANQTRNILCPDANMRIPEAVSSNYFIYGCSGLSTVPAFQALTVNHLPTTNNFNFTLGQTITTNDAETGGASAAQLTVCHNTTGTPSTLLGSAIEWQAETSTNTGQAQGRIACQWSNITHANRTAFMDFLLENNGASFLSSMMRLYPSGGLCVNRTTDPGAGYIDANTGFKVAGTALDFSHLTGACTETQRKLWDNASGTSQGGATGFQSNTYITNSNIVVPTSAWVVGGRGRIRVHMSKTAAGTATPTFSIYAGTNGSTSDTAVINAQALGGAQTAAVDNGVIDIYYVIRGPLGSSCVVEFELVLIHNVNGGGLWGGVALTLIGTGQTWTMNTTTVTNLGMSYNGGASVGITVESVQHSYSG